MRGPMSGASLLGVGVGLLVGAAAGLVFAPMRGGQMRATLRSRGGEIGATLRSRADQARQQGLRLLEEGRRAFRTTNAPIEGETRTLTATLGEIAQFHTGSPADTYEARS